MQRFAIPTSMRPTLRLVVLSSLAVGLVLPAPATASQASKRVAKQAENATLGRTVLTTPAGRTLYSLSAETKGRFICTGACVSTWRPLLIAAGVRPTGPVRLGTIERPDGRTQVTFKGRPLYSFSGDSKPGDANGEGIRDVGIWRAAAASATAPAPQPQPENPYPY